MLNVYRSLWIWLCAAVIIAAWLPLHASSRLLRARSRPYRTGPAVRTVGIALAKQSLLAQVVSGENMESPQPYGLSFPNHQSMRTFPLWSHLPWEMKWLGKVGTLSPADHWNGDETCRRYSRRAAQQSAKALRRSFMR